MPRQDTVFRALLAVSRTHARTPMSAETEAEEEN